MERRLEDLARMQRETARKVIVEDRFETPIEAVAGVDLAFLGDEAVAACIVMDHPPTKVVDIQTLVMRLDFPYVPTFLTFREGPPIVKLISSLRTRVNIFIINGQGIAHPRRCGLASHVGVSTGRPTIGVTVSRLVGEYESEPEKEGEAVPLTYGGERVGWVLRSRRGSKPIFVSPGHMVGLDSSLRIVKDCLRGHRLPESLWTAHMTANKEKRRLGAKGT